jgi:hypothetical protein
MCNPLEADHELPLVNVAHMEVVPGHRTNIKVAEWFAELLSGSLSC